MWIAAQLTSWSLILFGTASPPRYLAEYLASRFPTAGHTVDMMQTLRPTPVAGFFTAVTDTFSSNSSTEPTSANIGAYIYSFYICELLLLKTLPFCPSVVIPTYCFRLALHIFMRFLSSSSLSILVF